MTFAASFFLYLASFPASIDSRLADWPPAITSTASLTLLSELISRFPFSGFPQKRIKRWENLHPRDVNYFAEEKKSLFLYTRYANVTCDIVFLGLSCFFPFGNGTFVRSSVVWTELRWPCPKKRPFPSRFPPACIIRPSSSCLSIRT